MAGGLDFEQFGYVKLAAAFDQKTAALALIIQASAQAVQWFESGRVHRVVFAIAPCVLALVAVDARLLVPVDVRHPYSLRAVVSRPP